MRTTSEDRNFQGSLAHELRSFEDGRFLLLLNYYGVSALGQVITPTQMGALERERINPIRVTYEDSSKDVIPKKVTLRDVLDGHQFEPHILVERIQTSVHRARPVAEPSDHRRFELEDLVIYPRKTIRIPASHETFEALMTELSKGNFRANNLLTANDFKSGYSDSFSMIEISRDGQLSLSGPKTPKGRITVARQFNFGS